MAPIIQPGYEHVSGARDKDGNRTWVVRTRVIDLDGVPFGPAEALAMPGLFQPGDMYLVATPEGRTDVDAWAFCTLEARVTPEGGQPYSSYVVEQTFTNVPPGSRGWCKDAAQENPLLQPPAVTFSFLRGEEEATYDLYGRPIRNSAHEMIRGSQLVFDTADRMQVVIELNLPVQNLELYRALNNTLNALPLWGLPPRTIRLTIDPGSVNFYGRCFRYYRPKFTFEVRDDWDRWIPDEGSRALNGRWNATTHAWELIPINGEPPDPINPTHFVRITDVPGNMQRLALNGAGIPYVPEQTLDTTDCGQCDDGTPDTWHVTGLYNTTSGGTITPVRLAHLQDCTWTASWERAPGETKAVVLTYTPLNPLHEGDEWNITIDGVTSTWDLKGKRWKCRGPNTLINQGIFTDPKLPRHITLSVGNEPGRIFVAKYGESNFLLLGAIPLLI